MAGAVPAALCRVLALVAVRFDIAAFVEILARGLVLRAHSALADAWKRLTEAFGPVDPRSIEIEIRPARIRSRALPGQRDPSRVVPMARPMEIQSLDAC